MGRKLEPGIDKISEDWVKKEIKAILRPYQPDLHWFMPPASMYAVTGIHDFLICQYGIFWTIEAKAGNNKPSDNQIVFARHIQASGGGCICINEFNLNTVFLTVDFIAHERKFPRSFQHNFDTWTPKNPRFLHP